MAFLRDHAVKILDICMKLLIGAIFLIVHWLPPAVYPHDWESGRWTHDVMEESFPNSLASVVITLQVVITLTAVGLSTWTSSRFDNGNLIEPFAMRKKSTIPELFRALMSGATAMVLTMTIVEVLKKFVGKPRPDFLGRCFGTIANMPHSDNCDPLMSGCLPDYTIVPELIEDAYCWERQAVTIENHEFDELMLDGRASFPSAHGASAAVAATWASFTIGWLLSHYSWGFVITHVWLMMNLTVGLVCTLSRCTDYRHEPIDVVVGFGLGVIMAIISFKAYYPGFSILRLAQKDKGMYADDHTTNEEREKMNELLRQTLHAEATYVYENDADQEEEKT